MFYEQELEDYCNIMLELIQGQRRPVEMGLTTMPNNYMYCQSFAPKDFAFSKA